jgi:hypothetical protein
MNARQRLALLAFAALIAAAAGYVDRTFTPRGSDAVLTSRG